MSSIYKDENSDEWYFPHDSYILSETDAKGLIIYANDLFCEIAGLKREEILGQAHNIVRHPDMPRIAFKSLWTDIQNKGFWRGIVKNIRKDGSYYWVDATVLRKIDKDGEIRYLSIRRAPDRLAVENSISLYAKLKEDE